ncbi:hypothetical protein LTR85_009413 [Meristemomyces frigidus]|nr:hypothetical protein LTR85_009413 [Meristemomyces frigidus]
MDYMRNELNTPLPKVYAWSCEADNPVRAEYIVMEKVAGVPLDDVWPKMDIEQRWEVTKAIAQHQQSWLTSTLPGYGSLYYTKDLHGQEIIPVEGVNGRYAIGPTTGRDWSDDSRLDGAEVIAYLQAIANREVQCINALERFPKSPVTLCGPGLFQPTRERKLQALQCYSKLLPFLAPLDRDLSKPCIWHGDLHVENIFVNPECPSEITSIIDWQATEVTPRFVQARQPHFLDYNGPKLAGLEMPRLTQNRDGLSSHEREKARALFNNQSLVAFYRMLVKAKAPELHRCFEVQQTPAFDLLLLARNLLVDGEATYLSSVVELAERWPEYLRERGVKDGNVDCPVHFTEGEKAAIEKDAQAAYEGIRAMAGIQDALGDMYPEYGVVKHDDYDEVKAMLRQVKEQVLAAYAKDGDEKAAWEEAWPFQD